VRGLVGKDSRMESTVGTDDDIFVVVFRQFGSKKNESLEYVVGHGCRRSQSKKTCIGLLKRRASKIKRRYNR
jgi:hypothetical protein